MPISYTYKANKGSETKEFNNVPCFMDARGYFDSKEEGKIIYFPDTSVNSDVLSRAGCAENYIPDTFIDVIRNKIPSIKEVFDYIDSAQDFPSLSLEYQHKWMSKKYGIYISTKIPFLAALAALSAVRYVEEQPSLVKKFIVCLGQARTATEAFLWASSSHANYSRFANHNILRSDICSIIKTPDQVSAALKNNSYAAMWDILSNSLLDIGYTGTRNRLTESVAKKPPEQWDISDFRNRQACLLDILKEKAHDTSIYTTS